MEQPYFFAEWKIEEASLTFALRVHAMEWTNGKLIESPR
jgi:hypothetical protein